MATYSWKLVNTYVGNDFDPSKLSLSNSGTTIVSGQRLIFTAFRLEHGVLNNLGGVTDTDDGRDPLWVVTSISPSGQYIARTQENRVKIYTNIGFGNWQGTELYHAPNNDYFGASSSFDVTGSNTWIAVGAPNGLIGSGGPKGYNKVFNYTNNVQVGSNDVVGDSFGDMLGAVVISRGDKYLVCGQGKIYIADLVSGSWTKTQVVNDTFSFFVGSGSGVQNVNYTIAANADLSRYVQINGPMRINNSPRTTDPNPFTNSQSIVASMGSLGFSNVDMDNTGNVILAGFQDGANNVDYVKTYRRGTSSFAVAETITVTDGLISLARLSGDGNRIVLAGISTGGSTKFLSVYDYTLDSITPDPEDPEEVSDIPSIPSVNNPVTSGGTASSKKLSTTLIVIIIVVSIIVVVAVLGAIVGGYFFLRKR